MEKVLADTGAFSDRDSRVRLIDTGSGLVREFGQRTGHSVAGEMGWETFRYPVKNEEAARKDPERAVRRWHEIE